MGEYDKLLGRREALEDLNSSASGRPERAGQFICEFDGNATLDDRGAQRRGLAPGSPEGSAGAGSGSPSVCATSYLGIRQPDHGNAALAAEGNTYMARIRGAR